MSCSIFSGTDKEHMFYIGYIHYQKNLMVIGKLKQFFEEFECYYLLAEILYSR